jgi:glutamyl-tRNA synthetase
LHNYLYARANGGKFVIRIEDTDQSRLVPGSAEKLEEILRWAGIEADESPLKGGTSSFHCCYIFERFVICLRAMIGVF